MEYLLAMGGILVVVSAMMAAMGYRGREQIVGIDLGTTFSVVALRSKDKVTVLPDRFTGRLLVPSVVHYHLNGSIMVGESAITRRDDFPMQTIYNAKRFIGRPMREVADDASKHRYRITANTSRGKDESAEDAAAGFSIQGNTSHGDFWVSPIDVGAQVVKHIMHSVHAYLGYEIFRAVICVPAKFSARETKATVAAYEQGGIKVMRVLEEPTAAAIAYNLHKGTTVRHVLVYDIGGGTLDTSLLFMNGRSVSVLGVAGDDHLGGSDFDHRMQAVLEAKLAAGGTPVEVEAGLPKCSPSGLGVPAEKAKIELSSKNVTEVRCLSDDGRALSVKVTRDEFTEKCQDLFDRSIEPIKKVLEDQHMTTDHVDDVVLVGGASRMPQLRDILRRFFDGKKLHTEIDPDVTVAYGAANVVD
jgi:molecular chaperone DnaK (HSP70)